MGLLPPGFSSSGDVALDRRYRWARASLEAGEAAEACDILRQTAAEAPHWAPAWKLLADALLDAGKTEEARLAYEEAVRLDPQGALGARLDLARLGALDPTDAMQQGYVAALFDDYADRFDAHLTGALCYRGPQAILSALREVLGASGRPLRFERALDLGCGTGLMGEAIRPFVGSLHGVDLSRGMIAKARAKLVYDRLAGGELGEFVRGAPHGSFDLILAADVLVYVADLRHLLGAVARALRPNGLFAFTLQRTDSEAVPGGLALGKDNRFAHSADHVRAAAFSSSLGIEHLVPAVIRQEAGHDVPGLVAVLLGGNGRSY